MNQQEVDDNWDDEPKPKTLSEKFIDAKNALLADPAYPNPSLEAKEMAMQALIDELLVKGSPKPSKPVKSQKKPIPGVKCYKPKKKDGTRQLKVVCPVCGYTARTSRKWLDDAGAPYCPKPHEVNLVSSKFAHWGGGHLDPGLFQMMEEKKPAKCAKPEPKPETQKPISIAIEAGSVSDKDGKISIQI